MDRLNTLSLVSSGSGIGERRRVRSHDGRPLPTGLLIAMFVATLGEIASVPARQSLLGSLAPEDSRGIYIAVHSLNFNAGGILASLSVSLAVIVNSQVMAGLTFGLGVTAALLYWAVLSHATQFSSASSGPSVRPPS